MLTNTFCHIPGIGEITERRLWSSGLHSWDTCSDLKAIPLSRRRKESIQKHIEESQIHLESRNPSFFGNLLHSNLHWRLFPEFRDSVAYLDIETTGLDTWDNSITSIALYDGRSIFHYVQGENLEQFEEDITKYKVLVTYNGSVALVDKKEFPRTLVTSSFSGRLFILVRIIVAKTPRIMIISRKEPNRSVEYTFSFPDLSFLKSQRDMLITMYG